MEKKNDNEFSSLTLYDDVTFDVILKEIHVNSVEKKDQLNKLIESLAGLVKNSTDASVLVPLIANYLDVSVKNDDSLIKMANVVQRFLSKVDNKSDNSNSPLLTEEEKRDLLNAAKSRTEGKVISMEK